VCHQLDTDSFQSSGALAKLADGFGLEVPYCMTDKSASIRSQQIHPTGWFLRFFMPKNSAPCVNHCMREGLDYVSEGTYRCCEDNVTTMSVQAVAMALDEAAQRFRSEV
jgi:hypothetical protein